MDGVAKSGQGGASQVSGTEGDLRAVRSLISLIQTLTNGRTPAEIVRELLCGLPPNSKDLRQIKLQLQNLVNGLRDGTISTDQAVASLQEMVQEIAGSGSQAAAPTNPLDRGTIV
jgi:hypothetical protein